MSVRQEEVRDTETGNGARSTTADRRVLWFDEVGAGDTHLVGGKAASLGEMYRQLVPKGVRVPNGFATTTRTHREFVAAEVPKGCWDDVDVDEQLRNLKLRAASASTLADALPCALRRRPGRRPARDARTHRAGAGARARHSDAERSSTISRRPTARSAGSSTARSTRPSVPRRWPRTPRRPRSPASTNRTSTSVEKRASSTHGKMCASAFTERAIGYQLSHDMDPMEGRLGVVVMKMVRSDIATLGRSIHPRSRFRQPQRDPHHVRLSDWASSWFREPYRRTRS